YARAAADRGARNRRAALPGGLPVRRNRPDHRSTGRAGPAAALQGARAPPARVGRRGPGLLERAAGTDATVELAASRPDARSGNASVPGRRWVHPLRGYPGVGRWGGGTDGSTPNG